MIAVGRVGGLLVMLTGCLWPRPPASLRYSFTPEVLSGRMVLHVALDMAGVAPPEAAAPELPSHWGNATKLDGAVVNLKASSTRIAYDLVRDWNGPLRESVRHRAHLEPEYVEFNTSNALVHPKLGQTAEVDCTFEWNVPRGWAVASSFGSGAAKQRFRGRWGAVLGSRTVVMASWGKWSFTDEEAAGKIARIIRLERDFWKDDDFPYYLVTMVPFGPGQSGNGGSAFTNAFNLHAPAGTAALLRLPHQPGA